MIAPSHPDEAARLQALLSYDVLDTPAEADFDDLARIASLICRTPIALISLVDAHRQWFKARVGLDIEETPRDVAFCAHAILGSELLVVEDATADDRFVENPLVKGAPNIRFYAGTPLADGSGLAIGTLCVIDRVPRALSEDQAEALRALGRQVVAQFELRRRMRLLSQAVSRHEAAERRLRLSDEILKRVGTLILVADADGRITYANPSAETILGYRPEELLGDGWWDVSRADPDERRRERAAIVRHARSAQTVARAPYEKPVRRRDGETRWILWRDEPGPQGSIIGVGHDITERRLAEEALRRSELRLRRQNDRLLKLARRGGAGRPDPEALIREATEAASEALEIERTSVWLFDEAHTELRCVDLYEHGHGTHSAGISLQTAHFPVYFGALENARAIVAPDARNDPRTRELNEEYLVPYGVASLLDSPLRVGGRLRGAVCHEHIGEPRTFTAEEEYFSASLADLISLELERLERWRTEEALRQTEERYRELVEGANDIIYTHDLSGGFTSLNRTGELITGYSREEARTLTIDRLVAPEDLDRVKASLAKKLDGEPSAVYEATILAKDGRRLILEISSKLIVEGTRPVGVQGIARDITERREMERQKKEFLATVSHELKTPLTSIQGALDYVVSAQGDLPPNVRNMVGMAERNARRLNRLISDILDLDRLDADLLPMSFVDEPMSNIVERALDAVRMFAEKSGVELRCEEIATTIHGDPDRLEQVLMNLLSNAVKFSPKGGLVTVSAHEEGAQLEVSVTDRGRGVPAAYREAIFERFRQVQTADGRKKGGTGLGLAICKGIVERHGGSIGVVSEEGKGSTFWFRVPRA